MGVVHVDNKGENKSATLVHAFVGSDCESKVQKVCGVREVGGHCGGQIKLSQVLRPEKQMYLSVKVARIQEMI
jgi:hypothetical protein